MRKYRAKVKFAQYLLSSINLKLSIARRHVSVVVIEIVIIRTREALQVRERVSPSVDTNGRRGGGGVSGGGEASTAVIQDHANTK